MDEPCRLRRGEGYGACEDEPPEAQLQRRCKNGTVGAFGKAHQQSPRQGGKNPQKARGKFDIPVRKMRKLALVFSRSIRYNIKNSRSFGGLKE